MDINEINVTIQALENGDTTFSNCSKLADLYVVRDYLLNRVANPQTTTDEVIKEYYDILPSYSTFVVAKTKYQMGEIDNSQMLKTLNRLVGEITEFISILYSSTDTQDERDVLFTLVDNLSSWKTTKISC